MKLLLDTHSFLWFIEDDPRLSATARQLLEYAISEVFLSVGSLWEIAIKLSMGKLTLDSPFAILIPQQLRSNRIALLNITLDHAVVVARLELHHRDPFDRLLVA